MATKYLEDQIQNLRASAGPAQRAVARRIQEIDEDPTLSEEGRRQARAAAKNEAQSELNAIRDAEKQLISNEITERQRLLDNKVGYGPSELIAFRDAQDRADRLADKDEALRVMQRSLRSGDTTLAHAIFRRALESGVTRESGAWSDVKQTFIEANPDMAEVASDLTRLQKIQDASFERTVAYAAVIF